MVKSRWRKGKQNQVNVRGETLSNWTVASCFPLSQNEYYINNFLLEMIFNDIPHQISLLMPVSMPWWFTPLPHWCIFINFFLFSNVLTMGLPTFFMYFLHILVWICFHCFSCWNYIPSSFRYNSHFTSPSFPSFCKHFTCLHFLKVPPVALCVLPQWCQHHIPHHL